MTTITKNTTVKELAGILSSALEAAGIDAVLVGGAAVSIYSDNIYQTYDLDFMTSHRLEVVADALRPLGFEREGKGRHFVCPNTEFLVEFPASTLSFGDTYVSIDSTDVLKTALGNIRVITPTQSVMDRLAAYFYWNDTGSFDQAKLIIKNNAVDWQQLTDWIESESQDRKIVEKLKNWSRTED
jgi:hypothetical protein